MPGVLIALEMYTNNNINHEIIMAVSSWIVIELWLQLQRK